MYSIVPVQKKNNETGKNYGLLLLRVLLRSGPSPASIREVAAGTLCVAAVHPSIHLMDGRKAAGMGQPGLLVLRSRAGTSVAGAGSYGVFSLY